jgi:ubiquinone/menaquinone biosynthesis C-methylase UbiE
MTGETPEWFAGSIPETYHKYLGPILFEFSAGHLAECVSRELEGEVNVLEVACGTGISTSFLANNLSKGSLIQATDYSQDMLDLAERYYPKLPGVRFSQADAQDLDFSDNSMDAVICQFGLMFFPDKSKALSEFHRVLKPGGLLALSTWSDKSRFPFALIVDEVVSSFFSSDPPDMTVLPYSLGTAEILDGFLTDGGFEFSKIHEVSGPVRVEDFSDFTRGLVGGNPTILEIERRATASIEDVIDACVATAIERLGPPPRDFEFPAIFGFCRKPD